MAFVVASTTITVETEIIVRTNCTFKAVSHDRLIQALHTLDVGVNVLL